MTFIVGGYTNTEIAQSKYLNNNTVKTYIRSAYTKIGIERRHDGVRWGIEQGFHHRRAPTLSSPTSTDRVTTAAGFENEVTEDDPLPSFQMTTLRATPSTRRREHVQESCEEGSCVSTHSVPSVASPVLASNAERWSLKPGTQPRLGDGREAVSATDGCGWSNAQSQQRLTALFQQQLL